MKIFNDEDFNSEAKGLFKSFGLLAVIGAVISIGSLCGVIWFVFWCLKHFGVI